MADVKTDSLQQNYIQWSHSHPYHVNSHIPSIPDQSLIVQYSPLTPADTHLNHPAHKHHQSSASQAPISTSASIPRQASLVNLTLSIRPQAYYVGVQNEHTNRQVLISFSETVRMLLECKCRNSALTSERQDLTRINPTNAILPTRPPNKSGNPAHQPVFFPLPVAPSCVVNTNFKPHPYGCSDGCG